MNTVSSIVAHQPADHPYVRHLASPDADADVPDAPGRVVWDVPQLRADGIRVVHIHFGFEHLSPRELTRWVDALGEAGIALVYTVHDLDNPHVVDQRPFHQSAAILIEVAAAVLTLTPAAAAMIEQRYGRSATVVSHPHVVPLNLLERLGHKQVSRRRGVYVHAATVRPNFDVDLVETLVDAAGPLGGLHVHVRDSASPCVRRRLERLGERGATVDVGPRLRDDELWDRIAGSRLIVLPYRWGTHSGLLEAARDLGTPSLAPGFGGYCDQGAHRLDLAGLGDCLRRSIVVPTPVTAADRRRQRHEAATLHRRLYDQLGEGWS